MNKIICLVLALLPWPALAASGDSTDYISTKHADAEIARDKSRDLISALRSRRQGVNLMSFADDPNGVKELEPAAGTGAVKPAKTPEAKPELK